MTEQPRSPSAGRRAAIASGAGALALVGIAAGSYWRTSNPSSQQPVSDPTGGTPLRLKRAVAADSPTPAPATPTATTTPTVTVDVPVTAVDPAETTPTPTETMPDVEEPVRVLQDPADDEMPQDPEGSNPAVNDQTESGPAVIEPSEAYQAPPPEPTLTGTSPHAPNLVLRTTPSWHLARRAGLSSSTVIAAEIEAMGEQAWIDSQLAPSHIDDSQAEQLISRHFRWATAPLAAVAQETEQTWKVAQQLTNSLLTRSRFTRRVLAENVYDVLANHIYLPSLGKASSYCGEYDQLIRSHGLGRYADLLHAVITHPAILIELDNQVNTKTNPNENLGRELLELYTVGVGNYTEQDVRNSALLLTGHTLNYKEYRYEYREQNHHTGPLTIMGFSDENSDATHGPALLGRYLNYLASHPGTAQRLARKFAIRFISDEPSQATIDELARVYLDSDTSISALVRATLLHPEFKTAIGAKWRRPGDLLCSIARASQVTNLTPRGTVGSGHEGDAGLYGWLISTGRDLPRHWPVVDGYPDVASYWNSASITLPMLNATQSAVVGDKRESGETDWAIALSVTAGDNAVETARRLTWHLTGYAWPQDLVVAVADLLLGDQAATLDSVLPAENLAYWVSQAVRVIFASPYGSCK